MGILLCNPLPSLRQVCNSWVSLSKQYAQNPAPGTHVDTEGSHTFNQSQKGWRESLSTISNLCSNRYIHYMFILYSLNGNVYTVI